MLSKVMEAGRVLADPPSLFDCRARCASELSRFDSTYRRLLNPHLYKVSITEAVRDLKASFIERYRSGV